MGFMYYARAYMIVQRFAQTGEISTILRPIIKDNTIIPSHRWGRIERINRIHRDKPPEGKKTRCDTGLVHSQR